MGLHGSNRQFTFLLYLLVCRYSKQCKFSAAVRCGKNYHGTTGKLSQYLNSILACVFIKYTRISETCEPRSSHYFSDGKQVTITDARWCQELNHSRAVCLWRTNIAGFPAYGYIQFSFHIEMPSTTCNFCMAFRTTVGRLLWLKQLCNSSSHTSARYSITKSEQSEDNSPLLSEQEVRQSFICWRSPSYD